MWQATYSSPGFVRQLPCRNQNAAPGLWAGTSHCHWLSQGAKGLGLQVHWNLKIQLLGITGDRISLCSRGLAKPTTRPAFTDFTLNEGYRLNSGTGNSWQVCTHFPHRLSILYKAGLIIKMQINLNTYGLLFSYLNLQEC